MRKISLSLLLAFSLPAWGISNIESERPGLPKEGFSGKITLGINGKTGNKKEEDYQFGTKISVRNDQHIYLFIAERLYGTTREIKDTDEAFIHGRYGYLVKPNWGIETFAQWEEDEFANIASRYLLGGGGRYLVVAEENVFSLSVGLGAFREQETLDLVTYTTTNWNTRLNSYVSYKHQLNENVYFSGTTYLQPSMTDSEDRRMLLTLGFNIKLSEKLNLNIAYHATHDSLPARDLDATPPIDNYRTNTEYTTTLGYSF